MIKCEVHHNCKDQAVAKINLPGPHAQWACEKGFNEWQQQKETKG